MSVMQEEEAGKRTVIAIDQSLSATGVCRWYGDGQIDTNTIKTGKMRGVERLAFIRDTIKEMISPDPTAVVVREAYAFGAGGKGNTFSLGELGGMIDLLCYDMKLPCGNVSSSRWKKMLFGTGAVSKDTGYLMLFKNKTGMEFVNDNEADAYGIAHYTRRWMEAHDGSGLGQWTMAMKESILDKKAMKKDKITAGKVIKEGLINKYLCDLVEDDDE